MFLSSCFIYGKAFRSARNSKLIQLVVENGQKLKPFFESVIMFSGFDFNVTKSGGFSKA